MKFLDTIRLAMRNLSRTKFRSFLTILGVVIGISAIVLLVSLGVGLQQITANQIADIDALTTVNVSQIQETANLEAGKPLTQETVKAIKNVDGVKKVSESVNTATNVLIDGSNTGAMVYGIRQENQDIEVSHLSQGNYFTNDQGVVLSLSLAKAFTDAPETLINQETTVKLLKSDGSNGKDLKFKITGIDDNETTNIVYAPLDVIYKQTNASNYSGIKVKTNSRSDVENVKNAIKNMGYQTATIKDLIDQVDKVFLLFQIILGIISGIGLVVSSLGIVNTMTISLLERTHEIGIMKAIGASNRDVRRLFFAESAIIGFLGGVTGVALAYGLGSLFNLIVDSLTRASGQNFDLFIIPLKFALGITLFAILVAVLAGLYPARRAQKVPLIDALRQ